jgi:ABC-type transport system substrate-binding protein
MGPGRVSRRQFLVRAGELGVALALFGCAPQRQATEMPPPEAGPRRGGVWNGSINGDPPTIDPFGNISFLTKFVSAFVYSRLFMFKPAPVDKLSFEITGDLAESYQVSGDGLVYTIRLRPNARFHPPIGRQVTAEDVVYSYQRFIGEAPGSKPATNYRELADVVESVEARDPLTVVFKLKFPYAPFLTRLADTYLLFVMPRETGQAFDPAQKMVGSGPWIFEGYEVSRLFRFRRNPDWHLGPDRPYLDRVELNVLPEYQSRVTQFLGGNLDGVAPDGADLVRILNGVRGVQVVSETDRSVTLIWFSGRDPQAPWRDPRVRRAISMAIDRDALIEAAGVREADGRGIRVFKAWNNLVPAIFGSWWLDPRGKDISPEVARYFRYDPEGARRLLAEAGYPNGFRVDFRYTTTAYGQVFNTQAELVAQYLRRIGLDANVVIEDYASQFITRTVLGEFDGIAMGRHAPFTDPGNYLEIMLESTNPRNRGKIKDPKLDAMVAEMRTTQDEEKRRRKVLEIQQYANEQMYYVPLAASVQFTAYQPWVRGAVENRVIDRDFGDGAENFPYFWKAG